MNEIKKMSLSLVKDELDIAEMVEIQAGSGQDVINCVSGAYTSNGWISVWAWVQTAFIPATAAAIAGFCGIKYA